MPVQGDIFQQVFQAQIRPHLEAEPEYRRAQTFECMFRYLETLDKPEYLIVETGCMRHDGWSDGRSTYQFDQFVQCHGGRVFAVDIAKDSCDYARQHTSSQTTIVNDDSVAFLRRFAEATEQSIDLLYLDSLDLCWENTHPSALHHLMELCAAMPALNRSSLIVVDDHGSSEAPGKSAYVAQWMRHVGGRELFADYQIGWTLSHSEVSAPDQHGISAVTNPPTPQTQVAATEQPDYSRPARPESAPLHEPPSRVAMIADSNSQGDDLLAEYFVQPAQYPGGFQGRGVVIAGGGGRFAVCTWVCV